MISPGPKDLFRALTSAALVCALLTASPASAYNLQYCLSDNQDLYVIISSNASRTQTTSLALTSGGPGNCIEPPGSPTDPVLTALAVGTGSPLLNIQRTKVMSGFITNSVNCSSFDASAEGGRGRLTLPGPVTRTVSLAQNGGNDQALVSIAAADAAAETGAEVVPAAKVISGISRTPPSQVCTGTTFVFPSGGDGSTISSESTGEVSNQAITIDDTESTRVGNEGTQTIPDGFALRGSGCGGSNPSACQIIVFVAKPNGSTSGVASVAGFQITDDSNRTTLSTDGTQQPLRFTLPEQPPGREVPALSFLGLIAAAFCLLTLVYIRSRQHRDTTLTS